MSKARSIFERGVSALLIMDMNESILTSATTALLAQNRIEP